jgi:hypothetical protein
MTDQPSRRQQRQLCLDYLTHVAKGARVDSMGAAIAMQTRWGVRVDWHEMSAALEELKRCEEAVYDGWGHDGQQCYIVC